MPVSALLLLGTLLGPIERGEATFRPTAAEAEVPERFRLAAATFRYELEELRRTPTYTVSALRFPSPITTPDPENNTVHAEYFRPEGPGRRPAVIVLHILGADFALSRYLAARLADRGVAALFVKLPYYGERRPAGSGKRFLSVDVHRSITAMRQGVCDVRRAAAWLAGRAEVDPAKLGVTGISLGGIVSSLAAAIDPTLNRAAVMLAGGHLADILWEMPEGRPYRALWIAAGGTKADLEALTRPFDPLTYAHRLRGKRLLMIAGNADEVIPPRAARALWEAAGRPPICWLDCGHYSAVGYLLPAFRQTVAFFAAELPPEAEPRPGICSDPATSDRGAARVAGPE
ncbi:MAG: alpha/beta hydrolase family protein [Isosphaeraceae bacterium]|nr:alpha/beta hydrolase family protein [Isosphaeraceae bacterium]